MADTLTAAVGLEDYPDVLALLARKAASADVAALDPQTHRVFAWHGGATVDVSHPHGRPSAFTVYGAEATMPSADAVRDRIRRESQGEPVTLATLGGA